MSTKNPSSLIIIFVMLCCQVVAGKTVTTCAPYVPHVPHGLCGPSCPYY